MNILENGRRPLALVLSPITGGLNGIVSAFLVRDRDRLVKGVIVVALSVCFSVSSAIFNTTYEHQAKIDAKLTNGADVTLSGAIDGPIDQVESTVRAISGVAWAEPLKHRLAYVGNDLQDLYGINPSSIASGTEISNAYFENGNAKKTLLALEQNIDGILVSAETVNDFQLKLGDAVNIRLQSGPNLEYAVVPFRFVGIVREFPTAPKDSFLVANAKYIAEKTGLSTSEVLLVRSLIDPGLLASKIKNAISKKPAIRVTDIGSVDAAIGSSLVSFDLHGLMNIELLFSFPLIGGALGIIFFLGASERRQTFSTLYALGASTKQVAAFLWSEALLVFFAGIISGSSTGLVLSWGLVKMTTQVFDPPPETVFVPWSYILALFAIGLFTMIIGVVSQLRGISRIQSTVSH